MADTSALAITTPDRDLLHQSSKLENLPYDIKYLILQSIPDHGTLVKFSQASRVFYNIFREHRRALFQYLMFNEASEYMEESYLLACLGDQLSNNTMTVAYLDNLYQCYADSLSPTVFEHPWYYREVLRGGASMRAKISECHKGIKEHCDQFIRRELRPKMKLRPLKEDGTDHDELPPTDSERRRIMQALYKIWLLLKLHHVKVADPEEFAPASRNVGTPTYPLRADVARYLKLWDYWDLKVVQVLLPIFWNDMKTKYDKRGDSLIREALSNHEGDRHDDYTYFTLFLNTTLHLYFPHTGLKWFNTSSNEMEIHQHIKNVSNYLSDKQNRAHFESLGDFTGIAYIYFQQVHGSPSDMNGFPGPEVFDNVPLKRLGRPGRAINEHSGHGLDGKRRFLKCLNHASLAHSDLQSCMWDDWRLESWGYVTPDFTSELTDQDPLPTTTIEDHFQSFTL